jgi:hypothetical protein
MKQNIQNSIYNREFWFNKSPWFFNANFQILTYGIDALFILYSLISIPLYIFYHIFGDLGLFTDKQTLESNPSLKNEYMEYYKLNDSSLFWNMFNIYIPVLLILLSLQVIKNQTFAFYFMFMGIQKFFIFAYLMNHNLTLITSKSSFIYTIFNSVLILSYTLYLIHSVLYYLRNKNQKINVNDKDSPYGKYKINANDQPASLDTLVHEVQLRMDMAKMKFNSIMIKFKLHKILKRLLYQPKDFYFMQRNHEQKRQNEVIIRNIKGTKKDNNSKDCQVFNNQNFDNISTTLGSSLDNNYSKLDDDDNEEIEPLKM